MKTFLGFTTGLLIGTIGGVLYTAYGLLTDGNLREYIDKSAIE